MIKKMSVDAQLAELDRIIPIPEGRRRKLVFKVVYMNGAPAAEVAVEIMAGTGPRRQRLRAWTPGTPEAVAGESWLKGERFEVMQINVIKTRPDDPSKVLDGSLIALCEPLAVDAQTSGTRPVEGVPPAVAPTNGGPPDPDEMTDAEVENEIARLEAELAAAEEK